MNSHQREICHHVSKLLVQAGDMLMELAAPTEVEGESVQAEYGSPDASPIPSYYCIRMARQIWSEREFLTEREILAKLQVIYDVGRRDAPNLSPGATPTEVEEESAQADVSDLLVQRTAHEIWGQREWLTENEIAAKLHGVWNIARGYEREKDYPEAQEKDVTYPSIVTELVYRLSDQAGIPRGVLFDDIFRVYVQGFADKEIEILTRFRPAPSTPTKI